VDVLKSSFIKSSPVIHGPKILAFESPNTGDIDSLTDLSYVKKLLRRKKFAVYNYLLKNFKK